MAEHSISEILSFLNPARKAPGYFPPEQNHPIRVLALGCVRSRKNQRLKTDRKKIMEFRKKHPVHALMRHRTGDSSLVRMGVVVSLNPTPAGAHHEIQENRR